MNRHQLRKDIPAFVVAVLCLAVLLSSIAIAQTQKQSTTADSELPKSFKAASSAPATNSPSQSSPSSTQSTQSPAQKPASPSPTPPPSVPPSTYLLTPDQVELWLETVHAENRMWAEYLQAARTREAVLNQIRSELKCPGCAISKQPPPGKTKSVYMLLPIVQ